MRKLFVRCTNCDREFETSLQVAEEDFLREGAFQTFNSMEMCPHCHKVIFYVREHFFFKETLPGNC